MMADLQGFWKELPEDRARYARRPAMIEESPSPMRLGAPDEPNYHRLAKAAHEASIKAHRESQHALESEPDIRDSTVAENLAAHAHGDAAEAHRVAAVSAPHNMQKAHHEMFRKHHDEAQQSHIDRWIEHSSHLAPGELEET
jgi:hypothetical protein